MRFFSISLATAALRQALSSSDYCNHVDCLIFRISKGKCLHWAKPYKISISRIFDVLSPLCYSGGHVMRIIYSHVALFLSNTMFYYTPTAKFLGKNKQNKWDQHIRIEQYLCEDLTCNTTTTMWLSFEYQNFRTSSLEILISSKYFQQKDTCRSEKKIWANGKKIW